MRYLTAFLCWFSLGAPLAGQEAEPQAPPLEPGISAPAEPELETVDERFAPDRLSLFVDGLAAGQFQSYHLAGLVVVVVRGDELLLSRGYGTADLRTGREADPESTLFRLGDVSKLFIWNALLQLTEENRLSLNRDVNTYLRSFKVPDTFPEPVTVTDLMSHTAGFEARYLGLFLPGFSDVRPRAETFDAGFPKRVYPPGQVPTESDYGAALGALIVEDVTGESWPDHLASRILNPLGMSHTSIEQPLPPELASGLAQNYFFSNGRLERGDFEIVRLPAALGMSSTGADMGRFMLSLLRRQELTAGSFEGQAGPSGSRGQRTAGSGAAVVDHGLSARQVNGVRLVGLDGSLLDSHAALWMIPDQQLGVFLAYNSADGAKARGEFIEALLDYWIPPEPASRVVEPVGFSGRVGQITGTYLPTRRPVTQLDKLFNWWAYAPVRVGDDSLLLTDLPGRGPQKWREIEPFVFREVDGEDELVFRADSSLGRTLLLLRDAPDTAFERLPPHEIPAFHLALLGASALLFLTTLTFPLLRWLLVRRTDEILARRDATHPLVRGLASCLSLVNLVTLVGLCYLFRDPRVLLGPVPPALTSFLVLPVLSGSLTLILLIVTFFSWRGSYWGLAARLHFSLVAIGAVAFLWELNYWNLLGWQF